MSYQVITLEGFDEPWWFFDNWQNDMTSQSEFDDLQSALKNYLDQYAHLRADFTNMRTKETSLAAFWQDGDYKYCTPCGSDQQIYHSIMLVEDYKVLNDADQQQVRDMIIE